MYAIFAYIDPQNHPMLANMAYMECLGVGLWHYFCRIFELDVLARRLCFFGRHVVGSGP